MGYTKRQYVTGALSEIGMAAYVFDMPADALQDCLVMLDEMMAEWNAKGIRLGYPIPTNPQDSDLDEETDTPDAARSAIRTNLALRVAPMFGREPQRWTMVSAKQGYNALMAKAAMPPEMQLPSTLPAGAGNKPWVWDDAYIFGPQDHLQAGPDSNLEFDA